MADKTEPYLFGPAGGIGGNLFFAEMPPTCVKILRVFGRAQDRIDAIGVEWLTINGSSIHAGPFGGTGGQPFDFEITGTDEYLTEIHGSLVDHNSLRLSSLRFVTNKTVSMNSFGKETQFHFSFMAPPCAQITGIHGRAGNEPSGEVDALGGYMNIF